MADPGDEDSPHTEEEWDAWLRQQGKRGSRGKQQQKIPRTEAEWELWKKKKKRDESAEGRDK